MGKRTVGSAYMGLIGAARMRVSLIVLITYRENVLILFGYARQSLAGVVQHPRYPLV